MGLAILDRMVILKTNMNIRFVFERSINLKLNYHSLNYVRF